MHPRLVLDTPRPGKTRKQIFERVCDQTCALPPRKKIKRESSKAADDSAERAADEKFMLLGDLKHDRDFQPRYACLTACLTIDFNILFTRMSSKRSRPMRRKSRL